MTTLWRRRITIMLCVSIAVLLARFSQGPDWLEGLFYDTALLAHAGLFPPAATQSGVLVLGLDEASLSHPDLNQRPRALFGPVWAQTLAALRTAGAKVVVFDFILSFSGDAIAPGYDREFLRALHADRSRIVLGRSQSLLPAKKYTAALGFSPLALGLTELTPDTDGVYRNIPLYLSTDEKIPALAGAALALAGMENLPAQVLLAPDRPTQSLPTLALSDALDCARSDPAALAKAAGGKIVFIGSTLEEEDRKLSPTRFFPAGGRVEKKCATSAFSSGSGHVSGVYLHALAADMVLGGRLLKPMPRDYLAVIAGLATLLTTSAALFLRPVLAIPGIAFVSLFLWLAAMLGLHGGIHAAMGYPALLCAGIGGGSFIARFLFEERRRVHMQNAFGHYLAPSLVKSLSDLEAMPALGGEMREVSIMFADLSGFTTLSSILPPDQIITLTNQYLSLMAEEIEASSGYIDKYIGDAVMAVWGAPLALPDHARQAVLCAQRIARRIRAAHAMAMQNGEHGFSVKIGINSGAAVVGNVGAHTRLNYTAVGDTVNVAARLESVPGDYGCMIVLGEQTAALLSDDFILRELDRIAVKGRATPLTIFEPLEQTSMVQEAAEPYARALRLYRDRDFAAAAEIWEALGAAGDYPSTVMAGRARDLYDTPPPAGWDGVWRMTTK